MAVCFIILAVLTLISFIGAQIMGGLAISQAERFWNGTVYSTDIDPPCWAFCIWFLIYLWQAAWILYMLTTLCRQYNGKPVYQLLNVITSSFLAAYIINQLLNVGFVCMYMYAMQLYDATTNIMSVFLIWISVLLCLIIYHYNMAAVPCSIANVLRKDMICLVVLVQNGLAIYLSWLTMVAMFAINSYAVYTIGVPMTKSSCMILTLLAVIITVYFFLELTLLRKYVRYTFSTYPTFMWGLTSITVDKWDPHSPTSIYVLVLLLVVTIFFFAKIGVTCRPRKSIKNGKYATLQEYS